MSSQLEKLPAELLCNILNRLDRATLANFVHCSRQCHHGGIAILYENVELRLFPVDNDISKYENLVSFFQKNPQIAKHVKKFSVRLVSDAPDSVISQVMQLCGRFAGPKTMEWRKMQRALEAEHGAEVRSQFLAVGKSTAALFRNRGYLKSLLALLSSLETLDLEAGISNDLYGAKTKEKSAGLPRVSNGSTLHSVLIAGNFWGAMPLDHLQLPNLKRLYIHKIRLPYLFELGRWNAAPHQTNSMGLSEALPGITHLEIRKCQIRREMLSHLVLAPRALETFIYEAEERTFAEFLEHVRGIHQAARRQTNLKQLWLDHDQHYLECERSHGWHIENFSEFEQLRHLRIDSALISQGQQTLGLHLDPRVPYPPSSDAYSGPPRYPLGLEHNQGRRRHWLLSTYCRSFRPRFPRSIEEIYLTRCEDKGSVLYEFLNEVFQNKEDQFPALKKVTIELNKNTVHKTIRLEDRVLQGIGVMETKVLIAVAEAANIEFIMVNNSTTDRISRDLVERKWGMDEDVVMAECSNGSFRGFVKEILNIDYFNEHDYDENGEKKKVGPMGKETCGKEKEV